MTFCKKDRLAEERKYASAEDFRQVFTNDRARLYELAFLLSGDRGKAERILATSLEDSEKSTGVFKDWAHNWAKHTVIQSAIRIVGPQPRGDADYYRPMNLPASGELLKLQDHELATSRIFELDDFDRFVFVLTVLQRYSDHDCALLLSAFFRDVRHSRLRGMQKMAAVESNEAAFAESTPSALARPQVQI
jgi:DNA-directed RNA polymerase specialized sigma24 family protein